MYSIGRQEHPAVELSIGNLRLGRTAVANYIWVIPFQSDVLDQLERTEAQHHEIHLGWQEHEDYHRFGRTDAQWTDRRPQGREALLFRWKPR